VTTYEEDVEYAMGNFNTCDHAGHMISFVVDSKTGTKTFLGHCSHEGRKIDVEPTCRICLRHTPKKKKTSKKTAAARARIKQGRLREKERKARRESREYKKPGLGFFDPTNYL
jgi:hypothetical protein